MDRRSALFHIMAWYRIDDKPFPKPMMTQFTPGRMAYQGPVSLTIFPLQFKIYGQIIFLSSKFKWTDRNKILLMTQQLCCRAWAKICIDIIARNGITVTETKFQSTLNCHVMEKMFCASEIGPRLPCMISGCDRVNREVNFLMRYRHVSLGCLTFGICRSNTPLSVCIVKLHCSTRALAHCSIRRIHESYCLLCKHFRWSRVQ